MNTLHIHEDVVVDLTKIKMRRRRSAERIAALLQQIAADPDLIDRLNVRYFRPLDDSFDVDTFSEQQQLGNNLWRLKVFDLDGFAVPFRVIYAFVPMTGDYHALGVINRDTDYAANHPHIQRIVAAYERL